MSVDKLAARRMREEGKTLQVIGDHFGVTRQRISQVIGRTTIPAKDCEGCGVALPADVHHTRRYCSDNCRKRTHEKAHPRHCQRCGVVVARTAKRCIDCDFELRAIAQEARWHHIKTLWDAGLSMDEIAPQVGRANRNALGVEMHRMKVAGWDLPARRAGWKGGYRKGGPPTKAPTTRQQVNQRLLYAVQTGKVERPNACGRCGKEGHVDGHHHDYTKPLDVEWLCRRCHMQLHAEERKAAA